MGSRLDTAMVTPLSTTSEAQSSSARSPSGHAPRRRKVRKGTSSCWECKRRKVRCAFEVGSREACLSCRRRGCQCISQDVLDEDSTCEVDARYYEVGQKIVRVESLVNQLLRQGGQPESASTSSGENISCRRASNSIVCSNRTSGVAEPLKALDRIPETGCDSGTSTISSISDALRRPQSSQEVHWGQHPGMPEPSKQFPLSSLIHSFLPSTNIAALIIHRGKFFSLPIQMLRQPFKAILDSSGANEVQSTLESPSQTAHPIYLARKLIQLAISLQQMDPAAVPSDLGLEDSARDVAARYLQAASRYVTSQDSLVISPEGLETLMFEGLYHINSGSWRLAWLVFRRALGIASLLGFQAPRQHPQIGSMTPHSGSSAEFLWFRLVYIDRFLSLMLSLPITIADDSFANDRLLAAEGPLGRLERIHAVAMGRIILRNERMRCSTQDSQAVRICYNETQDIDHGLKMAARALPAKWWTLPKLGPTAAGAELKEGTARLVMQTHQHDLLVLLHLPYIIPDSYTRSITKGARAELSVPVYTYNKLTALNASREVLARFTLLHDSNYLPFYSRSINFKALTASTTLLLAHIESHRLGRANVLEHQRPHDLEIVEKATNVMKKAASLNNDVPGHSSVQVLQRITEVEAKSADGTDYIAWREVGVVGNVECSIYESGNALTLSIPYFGTIRILCRGSKRGEIKEATSSSSDVVSAGHSSPDNLESPTQEIDPAVSLSDCWGSSGPNSLTQLPIPGFTTYDFTDVLDS